MVRLSMSTVDRGPLSDRPAVVPRLFFATLTGPGKIWLQSLPFARLARRMVAAGVMGGQGEGSILGGMGTGD